MMDILVSCNDKYGMPTMVMLTSLMETNPSEQSDHHTVYMLESNLSDKWNSCIEALIERYNWGYVRLHLTDDLFASAKTKPYISKETYYRLLAHKYLPESLDRILWLDSDIIVRNNLSGLYGMQLDDLMAVACGYGPAMQQIIAKNAESLGMDHPETYFNAGVMLLNLSECRKLISEDQIMKIITSDKATHFMFPGQDTVNLLFEGKVRLEDYLIYNCMIHCIETPEDLKYAKDHASIVHFPGEAKPWQFDDLHFSDEWLHWYHRCYGDSAPLRRVSYFRLKAFFDRQRDRRNDL